MPVTGEYYEAQLSYEIEGGSACFNMFHFRVGGPGGSSLTAGELYAAIAAFLTASYDGLVTYMCSGNSTPFLTVQQVEWEADQWGVGAFVGAGAVSAIAGTGAGDPLPAGVAGLVRAVPIYPKHAGRKFIGGMTTGVMSTDGSFSSAFTTAMAVGFANLLVPVTGLGAGAGLSVVTRRPRLDRPEPRL